jgi:hypothetical protein
LANTRLVTGSAAGSNIISTGATQYQPLGNCRMTAAVATEVNTQTIFRTAGVLSNMYIRVTADAAGARTLTTRKNATAGAQTATITASTPGVYQDTTHTDTVAAGDKWNYSLASGASGICTATVLAVTFAATSTTCSRVICNNVGVSTAGAVTRYNPVVGLFSRANATEANAKTRMRKAGTFTNVGFYLTTDNMSSGTNAVGGRLNGAAGALTITTGTSATGFLEDTTHTDTVAAGDDYNSTYTFASAAVSTIQHIAFDFTNASGSGLKCISLNRVRSGGNKLSAPLHEAKTQGFS